MISQRKNTKSYSLASPIGGWNTRDSIADMPETDAVTLTNWFPQPSQVALRKGYSNWATGLPSQVNSVMAYNAGATSKLFAASSTGIYDCTAKGVVGASVQAITNDKMIHVNFATAGGNFLVLCNGTDAVLNYNGTVWSNPAITGISPNLLNFVYATKSRLWFVEKNSLRVWYLPVNSIAGAATAFDFSSLCRHGGRLLSMTSWTVTGGFGASDYTVFVTSEGEILIYQGTDPSSATTWSLVGIWKFGSPLSNKCFAKFGTDVLYLSRDGLITLSSGRFFAEVNDEKNLSYKIQFAISDATTNYGANFGWQVQPFPLENMLIVNIPVGIGTQQQYVMNSITNAWCNFTGWNANAWELYQDMIYFGANGVVCLGWDTYSDNLLAISNDAMQAPSYFNAKGLLKRWTMIRPILSCTSSPAVYANINIDFDTTSPSTIISTPPATNISFWDAAIWDTSLWGGGLSIYKNWQGANGIGYAASARVKSIGNGNQINWISTDFVYEVGQVL